MRLFIFGLLFLGFAAFGQEVIPPVVLPSILDQVLAFLNKELGPLVAVVAVVLELSMRVLKTSKPESILYYIAALFHKVAEILEKSALVVDKILQRLKEPKL
jgi:mannose/fructose/N-acetylgalactosamine-specific phosphotransferase system component IIC